MSFHEIEKLRYDAEKRRDVLFASFACILVASITIASCLGVLAFYAGWIGQ